MGSDDWVVGHADHRDHGTERRRAALDLGRAVAYSNLREVSRRLDQLVGLSLGWKGMV